MSSLNAMSNVILSRVCWYEAWSCMLKSWLSTASSEQFVQLDFPEGISMGIDPWMCLYSWMQQKIEQCDLFPPFLLHTWNCSCNISMENCLSWINSKEVTISTLLKRGLLDFFRYYQIFLLCSLKVMPLFCNVYSYCSCLLYLSHLFLYSFGIALSPHCYFSFILQTSKLLMSLHQVFLHQIFSLVPKGKCANFLTLLVICNWIFLWSDFSTFPLLVHL